MDGPDKLFQTRIEGEDASLFNAMSQYDGEYDWMSDPDGHLLQDSAGHQSIDALSSPDYETEPGLSPDSNHQEGSFPTPSSISKYSVMPTTPLENALEPSNGMSSYDNLNSLI